MKFKLKLQIYHPYLLIVNYLFKALFLNTAKYVYKIRIGTDI